MFRSKGFTITFIILSAVITALLVFFIYLVSGAGKGKLEQELEEIAESQYQVVSCLKRFKSLGSQ